MWRSSAEANRELSQRHCAYYALRAASLISPSTPMAQTWSVSVTSSTTTVWSCARPRSAASPAAWHRHGTAIASPPKPYGSCAHVATTSASTSSPTSWTSRKPRSSYLTSLPGADMCSPPSSQSATSRVQPSESSMGLTEAIARSTSRPDCHGREGSVGLTSMPRRGCGFAVSTRSDPHLLRSALALDRVALTDAGELAFVAVREDLATPARPGPFLTGLLGLGLSVVPAHDGAVLFF